MSGEDEDRYVSPECFRVYVSAEIKVPNTLIAVAPYVGHAALLPLTGQADLHSAMTRFATAYAFSGSQVRSAIKTVALIHRRFGIPVLPEGADLKGVSGIRVFPRQRFEVVYMEGVMNILEAILRLHRRRGDVGTARDSAVIELLGLPGKLATSVAAFAAAEDAVNSEAATERSEADKAKFDFARSGECPRPMAAADKDGVQAELMPLVFAGVERRMAEAGCNVPPDHVTDLAHVLTSPELHDGAA